MSATGVLLVGHGRFVQDLLLWCTGEFGYLRLADGFVQSSSIMPQKRNPVALEHARAIASKALGQAQARRDWRSTTRPLATSSTPKTICSRSCSSMFRDATRAVRLVAAAMRTAEFDAAALEARAGDGWTTLTELADTLARDHGVPFKTAHAIAGRVMTGRQRDPGRPLSQLLTEASADLWRSPLSYTDAELAQILSPRHFVEVRRTPGGPAPEETARASAVSRAQCDRDYSWWTSTTHSLADAATRLAARAARL